METGICIEDIKAALSEPLPGWDMQRRMAPQNRRTDIDRGFLVRDDYRESSILLLLYPNNDDLHFILIRRPEYEGVHSGQIAFPGGRREGDESYETTALREAYEEVGVSPEDIRILGALTSMYIPPSNFMVFPFVGYHETKPIFTPDAREVAEILEPSVQVLADQSIWQWEYREFPNVGRAKIPFLNICGHKVWGATAMILSEFTAILETSL